MDKTWSGIVCWITSLQSGEKVCILFCFLTSGTVGSNRSDALDIQNKSVNK
jgi:hypothetical protein